jgi:hypothetical protein
LSYIFANLYLDQHPCVLFCCCTYSILPVRPIIKQIDMTIDPSQGHLRRKAILWPTSSTRLVHQADTRDMTFGRPSAVQRTLVDWFFVGVETELDHAERYGTSHENIAAAICDLLVDGIDGSG